MRGSLLMTLNCIMMWLEILCQTTAYCTCNCIFEISCGSRMLVSALLEITLGMNLDTCVSFLTLVLCGCASIARSILLCCVLGARWVPVTNVRRKHYYIGNPAFGGRGSGICRKQKWKRKRKRKRNRPKSITKVGQLLRFCNGLCWLTALLGTLTIIYACGCKVTVCPIFWTITQIC